jgi:hypothetical protein
MLKNEQKKEKLKSKNEDFNYMNDECDPKFEEKHKN